MRFARLFAVSLALLLVALPLPAAITSTTLGSTTGSGPSILHHEDTSGANAQLVLVAPATDHTRVLVSVMVVCSATATVTVTQVVARTITSGTVSVLLPDIELTATTSGAMYSTIVLIPTDTLTVTVPAAGGGITCSIAISEEIG